MLPTVDCGSTRTLRSIPGIFRRSLTVDQSDDTRSSEVGYRRPTKGRTPTQKNGGSNRSGTEILQEEKL